MVPGPSEIKSETMNDRQRFLEAETALKKGNYSHYRALRDTLRSYPLYPYLVYEDLRRRLSADAAEEINAFLDRWGETPLAERLRSQWLTHLAQTNRWSQYLAYYTENQSVSRRCDYLSAMIQTGRGQEIFPEVKQLWLHGHSRPDQCDRALNTWREAGHLSSALVWARIHLAINTGETALAKYLKRFVDESERSYIDLWIKSRTNPDRVAALELYPASDSRAHRALVAGLQFLARRDAQNAAKIWSRAFPNRQWAQADVISIERQIGLSLAYQHKPDAIEWLSRVPHETDELVREWRVLTALRHEKWTTALKWLSQMSEEERSDPRWRYWRARCHERLGNLSQSSALLADLAQERSYYGFLAADRLGLPYAFNQQALVFTESDLNVIAELPGIVRAKELYTLQRWPDARREWHLITSSLSDEQAAMAAKIAQHWGWHARAILTIAATPYYDDLVLRFPTPHQFHVSRRATDYGLDRAWVFAVARQESAFMPDARSSKGALGLMQIMPATANEIAKKLKVVGFNTRNLLNSDTNIRFGSWYLGDLLKRANRHLVLAIASYNAGPHRTRRWLPDGGELDADIWIETIPFRETRRYIRRVLAYTAIYEMLLGDRLTRLSAKLAPVPSAL